MKKQTEMMARAATVASKPLFDPTQFIKQEYEVIKTKLGNKIKVLGDGDGFKTLNEK